MSSVIDNLKAAINGESNAKRKYELYAEKALEEGRAQVAKLFKAISSAEELHIRNHLRALNNLVDRKTKKEDIVIIDEKDLQRKVNDTISNLEDAIQGEIYENKKMYKEFEKDSNKTGHFVAELSFSLARKAEKVHANLFKKYLKKIERNAPIEEEDLYVCQICGNVELNKAPQSCPVCDHDKKFFKKWEN